jgi:hypothetical protein
MTASGAARVGEQHSMHLRKTARAGRLDARTQRPGDTLARRPRSKTRQLIGALEAENANLRDKVAELALETMILRDHLQQE